MPSRIGLANRAMQPFLSRPIRRIVLAVVASLDGPSLAADPPGFGTGDAVQLKAKAALEKEPSLRDLALLVSVRDGVVLVSGGVPDEATATKIEDLLTRVPGVSVVRVTTWVVPPPDPMKRLVGEKLTGPVTATGLSDRVVPSLAVNPLLPGSVSTAPPTLPEGIGPPPAARPPEAVVAQRVEPTAVRGMLQPPVVATAGTFRLPAGIDVPPAPAGPAVYPTIRPTRVPVAPVEPPPADIALALLAVRKSDPRFAGLTAEVRNGSAVVTGTAASKADAETFAAEVAKIAGVGRVTLGAVKSR